MKTRIVLGSVQQIIDLINANPALMALPSLQPLKFVAEKARVAAQECGCNVSKIYTENRGVFESCLNNLQSGEHSLVKGILGVQSVCYIIRNEQGKLVERCF